ncbi:hypothetical protein VP01_1389g1 [Puccinia sorghi]|uniref:Uncharacterized protein n=1 Tax=Puccinia sorghi TaxID=27349 RepID=A0A0L6VN33_9BASI|nr:hypothetical protein VP01_1389g1 [Puccinia sorghi]
MWLSCFDCGYNVTSAFDTVTLLPLEYGTRSFRDLNWYFCTDQDPGRKGLSVMEENDDIVKLSCLIWLGADPKPSDPHLSCRIMIVIPAAANGVAFSRGAQLMRSQTAKCRDFDKGMSRRELLHGPGRPRALAPLFKSHEPSAMKPILIILITLNSALFGFGKKTHRRQTVTCTSYDFSHEPQAAHGCFLSNSTQEDPDTVDCKLRFTQESDDEEKYEYPMD